ncbi:MAG: DsbA family protein [Desulfovibrionaceae bacterium]
MRKVLLLACLLVVALCAACAPKAEPKADLKAELAALLKDNPDVLLDFLREHNEELLDIVQSGADAKRLRAMRNQWEAELKNPRQPAIEPGRPIQGKPDAPVTIVEYSDFECPYCGRASQALEEAIKPYADKVRILFKHYPLPIHKNAMPAAQYFEAAAMQGADKAWALYYAMFGNQQALVGGGESWIKEQAKSLGLDMDRLAKDVRSEAVARQIKADMDEAKAFGFNGTPMFLVNGALIGGAVPPAQFESLIEMALEAKK